MEITIYTTATCGFCKQLKAYLAENQITFTEKHADQSQEIAQELHAVSGQLGVPFTVIKDNDGKEHFVLGFEKEKIDALLGLKI